MPGTLDISGPVQSEGGMRPSALEPFHSCIPPVPIPAPYFSDTLGTQLEPVHPSVGTFPSRVPGCPVCAHTSICIGRIFLRVAFSNFPAQDPPCPLASQAGSRLVASCEGRVCQQPVAAFERRLEPLRLTATALAAAAFPVGSLRWPGPVPRSQRSSGCSSARRREHANASSCVRE